MLGRCGSSNKYYICLQVSIMCRLVTGEDNLGDEVDLHEGILNETDRMDPEIRAQIARLEARITRVEARMEKLESGVVYLQRRMYVYGFVCLMSVLYAIFK